MENGLRSCDRRMPRIIAGVTWRDGISSKEVADWSGVKEFAVILRERRLRWYGHVVRRTEEDPLYRVNEVEVDGRKLRGRPKKTWRKCVEDYLELLSVEEEEALDRTRW